MLALQSVARSGSKFEVIERVAAQINAPWKIVSNDQRTNGHANGSMDGRGTNEAEVVTRPRLPPGLAGGRITETRKKKTKARLRELALASRGGHAIYICHVRTCPTFSGGIKRNARRCHSLITIQKKCKYVIQFQSHIRRRQRLSDPSRPKSRTTVVTQSVSQSVSFLRQSFPLFRQNFESYI